VRDEVRNDHDGVVEKFVKRGERSGFLQVIENGERINLRKCHSCPMQCDIMIL
jgi:hypothetical protein